VGADVLVTLAVDRGPLAVVGPLASLDPVVSVLVATVVLRERLHRASAVGVVLALTGIALVATG
jgi:drug/metabolite transporter (DMT)-like permease